MTKGEQLRLTTWRLKVLQQAAGEQSVARACRHFGISRIVTKAEAQAWLDEQGGRLVRLPAGAPTRVLTSDCRCAGGDGTPLRVAHAHASWARRITRNASKKGEDCTKLRWRSHPCLREGMGSAASYGRRVLTGRTQSRTTRIATITSVC
jgi:hypothetical protein